MKLNKLEEVLISSNHTVVREQKAIGKKLHYVIKETCSIGSDIGDFSEEVIDKIIAPSLRPDRNWQSKYDEERYILIRYTDKDNVLSESKLINVMEYLSFFRAHDIGEMLNKSISELTLINYMFPKLFSLAKRVNPQMSSVISEL
jgi:hypothetical protein